MLCSVAVGERIVEPRMESWTDTLGQLRNAAGVPTGTVRGFMSSTMVSLQEKAKETYDRAEENVSLAFEQEASQEQNRRRQSLSREKGDFNAELLETVGHPEGGDAELVLQLLTQGASVNVQHSESGWNPLMLACFHGHAACAELLIEHRANVNSSAGKRRSSPLHTACCSGDMSVPLIVTRA